MIYSQYCREVSYLCRNWFAIQSYLSRKHVVFQNDCDYTARRIRDTRDEFATNLRGILSHKIFEHFATTLRHLATHSRKLRITGDCFETALRPTRNACR